MKWFLMAIVCLCCFSLSAMDVWTASCYENIFKDAVKSSNDSASYHLVVAKNEAESFQVLMKYASPFVIESVSFDDLVSVNDHISSEHITCRFVEYVHLGENTIHQQPPYLVRTGAGYYPDPLSNNTTIRVETNETQPLWITVHTPKDCTAGIYNGKVTVKTDLGWYVVEYSVEVCDITIPDAHLANFDFMHHQQIAGTWFYDAGKDDHPQDVITQIYGWKRWTPQWWELLEDMAEKMRDSRCNVLFVNTQQLLLDGEKTRLEDGKYNFDWSKFDAYIQFFIDRNVIKKMEGIHFGSTIGAVGETYKSYILKNKEGGILVSSNVEPMNKDCRLFYSSFIPALYQHLTEKGWLEMWIQHVGDEAVSELQHQQYVYYMEKMKTLAPDMHCGDPTFSLASAKNAVEHGADVVTPIEELYQANESSFDSLKNKGVTVYVYNCCGPGNEWLNRFVDKPVWQQRSLGWLCYKWGVSGWLHWGWNFWVDWFKDSFLTMDDEEFKGDHYSVYPDVENNKIKNSIRQIAIRDMSEDYELLFALGKKNPALAQELADRIAIDAFGNYTTDFAVMKRTRDQLVRVCARNN